MDYKFCTGCGTKVEKHYRVCTQCGKQFTDIQISSYQKHADFAAGEQSSLTIQEVKEAPGAPTRSPSKKLPVTIGVIIVMLLLGGFFLGLTFMSKEKIIQRFEEALMAQDTKTLVGMLDSNDPNLKVTEENLFPFISYIEENPQMLSFSALEKSGFVKMHQSGKKWLFFDNFKFRIKSFYPVISANFDGTEIYINKERVGKINRNVGKTFGPYLIGEYNLKAVYNGKYATLDKEEKIDPSNLAGKEMEVNFQLPENYLSLYSDQENAFLFVNGKKTNQRIGEIVKFGPVVFDGSITIHAETEINGNLIKSNETTLVDEDFSNVGLIFDYQEDDPGSNSKVVTAEENSAPSEVISAEEDLSSIDVEAIVKEIRKEYNLINKEQKNYRVDKKSDSFIDYVNDSGIIKKTVKKDNGVTTEYYYWDDGSLFFIFTTTAKPVENRYYFKNNQMIRWIDSNKKTIDINSGKVNQAFIDWENFWINQIFSSVD